MKNVKLYTQFISTVLVIAMIFTGCSAIDTEKEKTIDQIIGIVSKEIDVSDTVLKAAKEKVQQDFDLATEHFPDYGYTNWKILTLDYKYTYEDLQDMKLVIYQMNYEFLSRSPENIVMAGGMEITEDNWVTPGYPNSNYLIFQQQDETLSFLESIMINDSSPGTQLFTDDLHRALKEMKAD